LLLKKSVLCNPIYLQETFQNSGVETELEKIRNMADLIKLLPDSVANQIAAGELFSALHGRKGTPGECHRFRSKSYQTCYQRCRKNINPVD